MIWLFLIVIVLVAVPFGLEAMRKAPDRAEAPGQFVQLSQGITHYRWIGPVRGPVIVAIHGVSTPSPIWTAIAEGLGQIGYRVLIYDLYGRGYSDAPPGPQNRQFFMRQLGDLLASQGLEDDLTLIGFSMGGSIATSYAASYPERMKRLILIAPAGIELEVDGFTRFCTRTPILGDWLWRAVAGWRMAREIDKTSGTPTEVPDLSAVQRAQLRRTGYLPAVLASRRGILSETLETEHRKLGHDDVPTVSLWGDRDPVIPMRALGTLTQWNRLVRQEVVAGADHWLPATHATQAVGILRDILREV